MVAFNVFRNRLLLKYSFLWIFLSLLAIVGSVFPNAVYFFAERLGFQEPSNFIFFLVVFFLLSICISLSIAVSQLTIKTKSIIQSQALHNKKQEELDLKLQLSDSLDNSSESIVSDNQPEIS
jgi:hypothetical protein